MPAAPAVDREELCREVRRRAAIPCEGCRVAASRMLVSDSIDPQNPKQGA